MFDIKVFTLISFIIPVYSLNNGLALTPPMGWISWARYHCVTDCGGQPNSCVNQKLYMNAADKIVSDGFLDAGYKFVNIDDCWLAKERDSNGQLVADPKRFPDGTLLFFKVFHLCSINFVLGIKALAAYVTITNC